jgi:hypothetical protein
MRSITRARERAQRTNGLVDGDSQTGTSPTSGEVLPDPELRALTGRLQPLLASRRPAKIFLTACGLGEGATTVAQRLANALASDGRQVLLCAGEAGVASVMAIDRAGEDIGGKGRSIHLRCLAADCRHLRFAQGWGHCRSGYCISELARGAAASV